MSFCVQVSDTLSTAESLLGDLNGYKKFNREAVELKDELYEYQREQFDGWSRQTIGAIDNKANSLSLETSGRLMELGKKDGKLRVHYSNRLVTLLREVRQLLAFGFSVSAKIQHVANTAQKFYRHAVVLKQVSSIVDCNTCIPLPCIVNLNFQYYKHWHIAKVHTTFQLKRK